MGRLILAEKSWTYNGCTEDDNTWTRSKDAVMIVVFKCEILKAMLYLSNVY